MKRTLSSIALLVAGLAAGCATTKQLILNLSASPPASRLAVTPPAFFVNDGSKVLVANPDENIGTILWSYIAHHLREKNYGAFLLFQEKQLLSLAEQKVMADYGLHLATGLVGVKDMRLDPKPLFDDIQTRKIAQRVPHLLVPVLIKDPTPFAAMIFGGPGAMVVRIQAYAIDLTTGQVVWTNENKVAGTYAALELTLKTGAIKSLVERFSVPAITSNAIIKIVE
jgi:hypothetical protein